MESRTKKLRLLFEFDVSKPMRPPMSETSPLQIESPRPVPPYRLVVEESACKHLIDVEWLKG